ncbi:uncharacterized protein CXQ87_003541 [Candidozyma duobushaemuli]|uniref:Exocyst complex component Sec10-like alpha-helical bundle domain-containing protein n=1 Tax=Candidozyma duobushaemuli TaxID=1231522 RepID=A0A2V1ADD5_9ASCO|nr:uncharacterized protein CXQ87_003541 [[Candida] duobushaemulonis]PVH15695.1 hypothetical protein CXQ87_003541 [[Candida] duobushaemulonis]
MAQVIWNADIDVYNPSVMPLPVAKTIAWFLDVPDLLQFAKTSKNTYRAANDPQLWISKLKKMGLWQNGVEASREELAGSKFEWLDNPLTCCDKIYKIPKIAKFQILRIRRSLHRFYADLQSNLPYERLKLFKTFQSPQEQAKMLSNLLMYNAINPDETVGSMVGEKITDLMEIFENALLRELEIHYDIQDYERTSEFVTILVELKNEQTLIDFFLQKVCFDNDTTKFLNSEAFNVCKFFSAATNGDLIAQSDDEDDEDEEKEKPEPKWELNQEELDGFIYELASVFNEESRIIDLIFPQTIPMMYKVSEELISNQLQDVILLLISTSKERGLYFEMVTQLYVRLTHDFLDQLNPSVNVGESYIRLTRSLIDVSYESIAAEYLNEEKAVFKQRCSEKVSEWKDNVKQREHETTQNILKHVKAESKSDFLSSFKKVFTISGKDNEDSKEEEGDEKLNYSKIQAQAKILAENIKSLRRVFSPELTLNVLNDTKVSLARLSSFDDYTVAALRFDIYGVMQEEFISVIESITNDHLREGFERALKYLKDYNPRDVSLADDKRGTAIEPLVIFFEAINMADMIVQMIDIFYKEEIMQRKLTKHENSVLNPSLQSKKAAEALVDKYVADGLHIGIDVLFKEIESVFLSGLSDSDYNPPPSMAHDIPGPTKAAQHAVSILEDNIDLLVDCADKPIVEVFQQEVAERFFQAIVKCLKRSTISVGGAVTLISDLNLYYDFILTHVKSNKRMIFPLFQALKKVGSIYLIGGEDAKAIGQLISDLTKFNGIFSQEEIYEFVQRRADWPLIKKHVQKVMYGLSLIDCTIV